MGKRPRASSVTGRSSPPPEKRRLRIGTHQNADECATGSARASDGPRKSTKPIDATRDTASGDTHHPIHSGSASNREPVASRADKKGKKAIHLFIEISDSSDSGESEGERDQPRRPANDKGKGREHRMRPEIHSEDSNQPKAPPPPPSVGRWSYDLNKLDIDQLEAVVIAARAETEALAIPHRGASQQIDAVAAEGDDQEQTRPSTSHTTLASTAKTATIVGSAGEGSGTVAEDRVAQANVALDPEPPLYLQAIPAQQENQRKQEVDLDAMEATAIEQILDIIPDANRDHVMVMVCSFLTVYGPTDIVNFVVQQVMDALAAREGAGEHRGGALVQGVLNDREEGGQGKAPMPLNGGQEAPVAEDVIMDGGDEVECSACCEDFSVEEVARCTEGHACCVRCLRLHVEHGMASRNLALKCVDMSECAGRFHISELRRMLPEKLCTLYERHVQQKELKEANIDGLEDCPFCQWACIIETPKGLDPDMVCGNQDECGVISCRLCRRKQHRGQTCMEVERAESGRLALEEAMSNALKRNCPRCQRAFIKVEGCNKMTCPDPQCLAQSCYVCKIEINGYDHFREDPQHPDRPFCPLFDDLDQRHAADIQEAVAQYGHGHP